MGAIRLELLHQEHVACSFDLLSDMSLLFSSKSSEFSGDDLTGFSDIAAKSFWIVPGQV